jgi:hypothetical protein
MIKEINTTSESNYITTGTILYNGAGKQGEECRYAVVTSIYDNNSDFVECTTAKESFRLSLLYLHDMATSSIEGNTEEIIKTYKIFTGTITLQSPSKL